MHPSIQPAMHPSTHSSTYPSIHLPAHPCNNKTITTQCTKPQTNQVRGGLIHERSSTHQERIHPSNQPSTQSSIQCNTTQLSFTTRIKNSKDAIQPNNYSSLLGKQIGFKFSFKSISRCVFIHSFIQSSIHASSHPSIYPSIHPSEEEEEEKKSNPLS